MLTVHHLGISQSDRIVWLCEELGIEYELLRYRRDPVTRLAPPEYKALHAAGTAPVITDGDVVLAESMAIADYIIAKHGGGRLKLGPDHPDFPQFLYWYHFSNGSLMPALSVMLKANDITDTVMKDRVTRALAALNKRMGEATWLAGSQFTAADIMIAFPLTTMRMFVPIDISGHPNILAYLQRIGARPAFQRAWAKADPDLEQMLT